MVGVEALYMSANPVVPGQRNRFPLAQCDILRAGGYQVAKAALNDAGGRAEPYSLVDTATGPNPLPCSSKAARRERRAFGSGQLRAGLSSLKFFLLPGNRWGSVQPPEPLS